MPSGPELGERPTNLGHSNFDLNEPFQLGKLMPILFGLVAGMLIMLLVVYFFPRDYKQSESAQQSAEPAAENNAEASSSVNPPPNQDLGSANSNLGPVQVTGTTVSGYPVVSSGAPRAVDYFGTAETPQVNNTPDSVPYQLASPSPCVDPPSVKGPTVRYAER
jgi:hypothetical protein